MKNNPDFVFELFREIFSIKTTQTEQQKEEGETDEKRNYPSNTN